MVSDVRGKREPSLGNRVCMRAGFEAGKNDADVMRRVSRQEVRKPHRLTIMRPSWEQGMEGLFRGW